MTIILFCLFIIIRYIQWLNQAMPKSMGFISFSVFRSFKNVSNQRDLLSSHETKRKQAIHYHVVYLLSCGM